MLEDILALDIVPSAVQMCSSRAGWHSLLLRHYVHDAVVELFEAPPVPAQLLVLVTRRSTVIESFSCGKWNRADHTAGNLGMTAPEERSKLRWHGLEKHETLHLFLPTATICAARDELRDVFSGVGAFPSRLSCPNPAIASTMLSLERAALDGMPDLYADSIAHELAIDLLMQDRRFERRVSAGGEGRRLHAVEDYMRAHLPKLISLNELSVIAGCSTFRLIRLGRAYWGETPFRRLTRLRIEHGKRLLLRTNADVIDIALQCGYSNPSHFAKAFRRLVGTSPTTYRLD